MFFVLSLLFILFQRYIFLSFDLNPFCYVHKLSEQLKELYICIYIYVFLWFFSTALIIFIFLVHVSLCGSTKLKKPKRNMQTAKPVARTPSKKTKIQKAKTTISGPSSESAGLGSGAAVSGEACPQSLGPWTLSSSKGQDCT